MKIFSGRTVIQVARKSRKNQPITPESMEFKVYKTAIYARLSREGQKEETIETQIEEVRRYIENRRIFELVDVYADNGYSGTSFQRPEFERLMEDLRNRKIDCIIVKDLSRFAREHIGAEDYLNNIFPFLGVRFIAVNDGYDNLNIEPQEYFLASFKNLAHAHFAAETSRKVAMAKRTLQEQGKFIGSRVSFGYRRDPDDKHKLIIDEEKAPFVRVLFERVAAGETLSAVCRDFNQYDTSGYQWTIPRLWAMLKKEQYKGTLVQRMTVTSFYKNEEMRRVPKEEQIRIENAVPAIVEPELWEKAQAAIVARHADRHRHAPENPYQNLVFCGKCGRKTASGFRSDIPDFTFNCTKCKSGVFAKGEQLNHAIREHLELPEQEPITRTLLLERFSRILIFDKKHFAFEDKAGDVS